MNPRKAWRIATVLVFSFWLVACGKSKSAEELFGETLVSMEQAIENRDIGAFMSHISDRYEDRQSRNKKDIKRIAQLHVLGNRNLHIYSHVTQMSVTDDRYAELIVFVALAGQPIDSVDALKNIRAELMRFRVSFEYDEDWKATAAQWKRAGIGDFL